MSRYIDADKILYKDLSEGHGVCWVTFRDWIKEMPTADVVEVVRCKDCKHLKMKIGWGECEIYKWQIPYEDHYCGYGERRKEDE